MIRNVKAAAQLLVVAAFLLFATCAKGDYMGGIWPIGVKPPHSSASLYKQAPSGADLLPLLGTNRYTLTVVPANPAYHEWNAIDALDSAADYGEHVAHYAEAQRTGKAHIFGAVVEVSDYTGEGNLWGLEVDVMTNGRPGAHTLRTGIGIVYGRRAGDERAIVSYGLRIMPWEFNPAPTALEWGVKVEGECERACVSVPPGQWISFDREGNVGMYFDESTGFLHFGVKGKPPALSIQMETGELRRG